MTQIDAWKMAKATKKAVTFECLEMFQFADGVRLAWVKWTICAGERRCVGVREVTP